MAEMGPTIGGGGGGGRIAIYPTANLFGGAISAYGGGGANWGGAGTVFLQPTGQNGQLILDNGGNAGTNTLLRSASPADLIFATGRWVGIQFGELCQFAHEFQRVADRLSLLLQQPCLHRELLIFGKRHHSSWQRHFHRRRRLRRGAGSGAGRFSSSPSTYPCSGAGHGGYGANSTGNFAIGGNPYDYLTSPTSPGSGGGNYSPYSFGGAGGGAIQLTVTGTLQVDGTISANGGNGSGTGGGGGSGGSIWLTVGTLSGGGAITANGGSGVDSVGGGGGGGIHLQFPATTIFLREMPRRMAAAALIGAGREPC